MASSISLNFKAQSPCGVQAARIVREWPSLERFIHLNMGLPTEFSAFWMHDPLTVALSHDRSLTTIVKLHIALEYQASSTFHFAENCWIFLIFRDKKRRSVI
jgi:hypothetical protein